MKARELSQVYDIFDPQEALKGEKLKEYYVSRESPIDRIGNALRKSKKPLKYLLVGSRGNGKSTELNRLAASLEGDLLVVPFSIKEKLNLYDVEYTDILLVIAAEIFKAAQDEEVIFSRDLKGLLDRWTERIVEDIKEEGMGGELGTGFSGFILSIAGKLRTEISTRKVTRTVMKPRLGDMIDAVNRIIYEAEEHLGRSVLVIIDDLDKTSLDRSRDLLFEHGAELTSPRCKTIFTLPQSLLFSSSKRPMVLQYFDDTINIGNIKIYKRDGDLDPEGCELMRKVALERMEEALISKEALNEAVRCSGGVMTEFIRIIRSAGNIADTAGSARIEVGDVERAIAEIKNDYTRILRPSDIEILKEIKAEKVRPESEKFQDLLFSLAVIEYSNAEVWYDVHPALKGTLQ